MKRERHDERRRFREVGHDLLDELLERRVRLVNIERSRVNVGLVEVHNLRLVRRLPDVKAKRARLLSLRYLGIPSQEAEQLRLSPSTGDKLDHSPVHSAPPVPRDTIGKAHMLPAVERCRRETSQPVGQGDARRPVGAGDAAGEDGGVLVAPPLPAAGPRPFDVLAEPEWAAASARFDDGMREVGRW
jgi:hypothetical protein